MNQGLAGLGAQTTNRIGQGVKTIDEVKAMLLQGVTPETLLGMGVPEEVIMRAITELEQELVSQQKPEQTEMQPGLAAKGLM